ncbi:MAG: hypothetical protein WCP17_03805 [bacterium]
MSEKLGGIVSQPEQEKSLEIKKLSILREIPEFSGHSMDSSHGSIESTKGLVVRVEFNRPVRFGEHHGNEWEIMVLLAQYVTEYTKYTQHGGQASWEITDVKAIESSGAHSATFRIVAPSEKDEDFIREELEKKMINDKGELLMQH